MQFLSQTQKLWRSGWQVFGVLLLLMGSAYAAEPGPDRSTSRYEVHFMTTMIDHHAMAVMMTSTCEQKAVHEDLRELCTDMRVAQSQEINLMQGWLQAWYGVTYSPQTSPAERRRMERMAMLPPAEYEIEFIQTINRHHSVAIQRSAVCLVRAYHNELVDLCGDMIQAQLDEIRLMQGWLCEWYGICHNRRHS